MLRRSKPETERSIDKETVLLIGSNTETEHYIDTETASLRQDDLLTVRQFS